MVSNYIVDVTNKKVTDTTTNKTYNFLRKKRGYYRVMLRVVDEYSNTKYVEIAVHRLLAMQHLGLPFINSRKYHVLFKDGDVTNLDLSNLEVTENLGKQNTDIIKENGLPMFFYYRENVKRFICHIKSNGKITYKTHKDLEQLKQKVTEYLIKNNIPKWEF